MQAACASLSWRDVERRTNAISVAALKAAAQGRVRAVHPVAAARADDMDRPPAWQRRCRRCWRSDPPRAATSRQGSLPDSKSICRSPVAVDSAHASRLRSSPSPDRRDQQQCHRSGRAQGNARGTTGHRCADGEGDAAAAAAGQPAGDHARQRAAGGQAAAGQRDCAQSHHAAVAGHPGGADARGDGLHPVAGVRERAARGGQPAPRGGAGHAGGGRPGRSGLRQPDQAGGPVLQPGRGQGAGRGAGGVGAGGFRARLALRGALASAACTSATSRWWRR